MVTHKATVTGYKQDVWFKKYAITNTISLKNLIKQYWVTYDRIDQIFVVHREDQEKPNMEFKMHEYGIHCYNPNNKAVVLINNVSKNKQVFTKRKLTMQSKQKFCTPNLGIHQLKISGGFFKADKS